MRTWLLLILLAAGCGTSYQPCGFTGGYSDYQISNNTFSVSFIGNGYISAATAQKYLIRRCCEVAKNNNYAHFAFSGSQNNTENMQVINSSTSITGNYCGTNFTGSGNTYSQNFSITKPSYTVVIKCFKEKPESIETIDVDFFLTTNFPNSCAKK